MSWFWRLLRVVLFVPQPRISRSEASEPVQKASFSLLIEI
jgi:hypothetical protein